MQINKTIQEHFEKEKRADLESHRRTVKDLQEERAILQKNSKDLAKRLQGQEAANDKLQNDNDVLEKEKEELDVEIVTLKQQMESKISTLDNLILV